VRWEFLNPPIRLLNGNLVHVVSFPKSWIAPHSAGNPEEGLCFPKRTNKGTEYMSYEEVRMHFLGYYEKRLKLQLLEAELHNVIRDAKGMIVSDEEIETHFPTNCFNLTIIESVLIDTYTITHEYPELLDALTALRNATRSVNQSMQIFNGVALLPMTDNRQRFRSHNERLRLRSGHIVADANRALESLKHVLAG
jgi:hypothetical protein